MSQVSAVSATAAVDATVSAGARLARIGEVEQFLQEVLPLLMPAPASQWPRGRGRPRVLPALCLWAGLLVCVLRGFSSQLALWRLLSQQGLWDYPRFPVSDQAVYKRLAASGTAPLEQLFTMLTTLLAERLGPYADHTLVSWATDVVALDETTLDALPRLLPKAAGAAGAAAGPPPLAGRLATVFDVRRQQFRTVQHYPDAAENEKRHARAQLVGLAPGTLVLADLGYFGFAWFDELCTAGYYFVSRLREKTSYALVHTFYHDPATGTRDALIFLGAHRADRMAHAVRLLEVPVGTRVHRYVTNVLAPAQLALSEIARLYARRWDVEMSFQLVKQHLGLHLLWSTKSTVVLQQVWAVLIIAQILQALRHEIAARAEADLFDVSMPLLVQYLPRFAADARPGEDPVTVFVERGRAAGFIRPARRVQIHAPVIAPDAVTPLPPGTTLTRTPRYAQRKCGSRKAPS